jgi:NAD(P)-dependent dehydrogenase (short-subunit alcohol dehydrogenase family)
MKIALIGASGNVGSRIAAELSSRGHQITAIARNPGKIAVLPGIRPIAVDIADTGSLAAILKGHAAVISSVHFTASDSDQLIGAVKASGVPRYLVVGGAQPSGGAGQTPRRFSRLSEGIRERDTGWLCLPRPIARRKKSRLDLPITIVCVPARRAHGKIPPR